MNTRRFLLTWPFLVILGSAVEANSQPARPLRERIPEADPAKYGGTQEGSRWANPFLTVHGSGIQIEDVTRPGELLSIQSALLMLETLPDSAWPYGRVVAVSESGLQGRDEHPEIEKLLRQLLAALAKMDVKVTLWPSA